MPLLSKTALLRQVEQGLQFGGWSLLQLSATGEHPARYRVTKGNLHILVRVYIWNISHGGGQRSAAEYRIQVTGLTPNRIMPEPNGRTLILGYWPNERVFSAFDYQFHAGPLGGSPSLQIGAGALVDANRHRFAVHEKANGEVAIAFRHDFLGNYIEHGEALHQMAQQPEALQHMLQLATDPTVLDQLGIEANVQEPRRRVLVQTRRTLRALDFRERVLTAYSHHCAMCGLQLDLLDGAHILPISEPGSTDATSNGIALCTLHHRAYDHRLLAFDCDYRIHVNDMHVRELVEAGHDGRLEDFTAALRRTLHLPPERRDRPDAVFVQTANKLRGWDL